MAYSDVYNIGAIEKMTIENLVIMFKEMTEIPSEIGHIPYEEAYGQTFDDMLRRCRVWIIYLQTGKL